MEDSNNLLFNTVEFERDIAYALRAFRKQYPSVTTGDLQTFVIAFQMGYGYGHIQGQADQRKESSIEPGNNEWFEWLLEASGDEVENWLEQSKPVEPAIYSLMINRS
jgi:hypothetical protein